MPVGRVALDFNLILAFLHPRDVAGGLSVSEAARS